MNPLPNKYKHLFRYVYALVAVTIIAAIAMIATLYKDQHADSTALDRVASYYLASAAISEQLDRDAKHLNRLLYSDSVAFGAAADGRGIPGPPGDPDGTLFSIRSDIMQLRELQERYAGDEFVATLGRLADRFDVIERLSARAEPTDAAPETIKAFELNIAQLYRLHQIAATDTLDNIQSQKGGAVANLWVLAAILFVAAMIGWYISRLLRQTLVNQTRAEEALAESQARVHHMEKLDALGQLIGGVAHDFNNLLTVILGQAELLSEKSSDNEFIREGLDEISRAAYQAALLTKQLLTFSRRQQIETQTIDLNDSIRDVEDMLCRLISEDIELIFHYGDIRGAVEMEPGQVYQIILNLFINSRDAMPHGGKISLATETVQSDGDNNGSNQLARGRYAKLVVTDNGVGMDELTRGKVFEPFFTTKPKGRGTGLGLSTVHGIVTAANGYIFVDSRLDKGTRFEIYLPLFDRRRTKPVADSTPVPAGSETILVVEDEEQIRTFLQDGLGSLGYRVLTAPGGYEGLEICGSEPDGIDVIVSDVVMPDMNGADFMQHALPMQPSAVGIFMSGYTDDIILRRGVDGLALPLINKPFKLDAIATLIRDRLELGHQKKLEL